MANAVAGTREELRAIPEGTDDAKARVLARWTGIGLMALGDHDDALVFLRQALDLATASGNARAVIATELNLGDAYRYAGEAETAEMLYRRALDGARGQHPELVDFALQYLGKHLMEQGSLTQARAHLEEGQFLDFHVDEFGFGEANLILCPKHEHLAAPPMVSCTVLINADGYLECDLAPGGCVVFDGALTPHGRTPLGAGESVILVSFGFRARDQAPRMVAHLPPAPL
ncbi:tetratricopeptide repeat protein [Streptomyces goshikiensis]|uniref:tetratricopeptide repeat protein n=1 Tax=Streptomyces goshikiensis TaxID=1942 RepID=UPI0033EF063B